MYKSHGNRPQGGWKGGNDRKFGGGFDRRDDRGFDRGEKTMFKATCASCGNGCEVPFKPNGSRPIYCRECFKKEGDAPSSQPMRFDRAPSGFDREERQMHKATCADCGQGCEVPFRPNGEKPIYCRACFGNAKSGATDYKEFKRSAPAEDRSKERFAAIEAKLDMVIKALGLSAAKPAAEAPAKPEKAEKAEAPKAEKPAADKAVKAAKAPAKKAAAKGKKK